MLQRLAKNNRATSAVEFALIAPFLILLIASILAYGSIFATSLSLQQMVAEIARATIGGLTDGERKLLAQTKLNAIAADYPMLDASKVTFAFDASSGTEVSRVTLRYDMSTHPAYTFDKLLPLPESPLIYSLIVTDGNGVTS
ncbi:MAG TPA: pilus assembly protein [Hyphomonadaceae bacterium]|nr:pilus assembly protein [Hyphomonadaceae bacterium]HPN07412.1 pilus assembly protein [Hyphomonadaceae bacterium]